MESLSTRTRAPAASLQTSWQRYALNNPEMSQSHLITEGTARHPQGEFTANHLTKAFQTFSQWRSCVVVPMASSSRTLSTIATKTGLSALREEYGSDVMQGPGPAAHGPRETFPSLSKPGKFPHLQRTEGPLHLSGPHSGMPGVFERRWGTGGTLGPGAGTTASSMVKQHPRNKTMGKWISMSGRSQPRNIADWRRSAERNDGLGYAEHSEIGPAARHGMSAGFLT